MKYIWWWGSVAYWIGIPLSKHNTFKKQNPTHDQAKQACWDYWLHHHLAPSWRLLAGGLYIHNEHGALEVLQMNYLKGENINRHILEEWLKGRGRRPTTWATLARVLHDVEKGELAAKLEVFSSNQL